MPDNTPNNEPELLTSIARGDQAAFRAVFDVYAPRVKHVANLFTHSESIAEDIVQDVFMKVWLKRNELPGIQNFAGWLFIVAKNYSLNALKKIAHNDVDPDLLEDNVFDLEPFSSLEARDLQKNVRQALHILTEQQRNVFEMAKLNGLKREEISEILGLSPNTVKMHLVRSTRLIRGYLLARADKFLALAMALLSVLKKN